MNKIFVINAKRTIISVVAVIVVMALCLASNSIVEVLEASNTKRLLPIYSVERVDKWVALTFDCAWSRSQ